MDRGVWWGTVHGVEKSWTQLSDYAQYNTKKKRDEHIMEIMQSLALG